MWNGYCLYTIKTEHNEKIYIDCMRCCYGNCFM